MSGSQTPAKTDARKIAFGMPSDQTFLAALGTVAVRHAQLEHVLRLTIKTLAGVTVAEALDATEYQGPGRLRDRIGRLARDELGEGQALIKLEALLTRCERATRRRNALVHSVIGRNLDNDQEFVHFNSAGTKPLPSVAELEALAKELVQLTRELNLARIEGFLAEALTGKR
jgi:hypothetical protein